MLRPQSHFKLSLLVQSSHTTVSASHIQGVVLNVADLKTIGSLYQNHWFGIFILKVLNYLEVNYFSTKSIDYAALNVSILLISHVPQQQLIRITFTFSVLPYQCCKAILFIGLELCYTEIELGETFQNFIVFSANDLDGS